MNRPLTRLALAAFSLSVFACSSERETPRVLRDATLVGSFDSTRGVTVLFGSRGQEMGNQTFELGAGAGLATRASGGPPAREGHAMAFDSTRGLTTLFGGFRGFGTYDGVTWVWDGSAWTQVTADGPSPRYSPAMTYDPVRDRVLLFGGRADTGLTNETWLFDGTTWTQTFASGPSHRDRHALVFDSARGVAVLFGGYAGGSSSGKPNNDTFEWDGLTWTRRNPMTVPSKRSLHGMAYDSARGVTVLFGGTSGSLLGDTWEWDGMDWTQRASSGPSARVTPAMTFDAARGVTLLVGGATREQAFEDVWEWDGATWTQRDGSSLTGGASGAGWLRVEVEVFEIP